MSTASATAPGPWISKIRSPDRRVVIIMAAIAAALVVAFVIWRMPPSVPDLPAKEAQALGLRMADAAQARDAEQVRALLDRGANPSQPGSDGTPAIVWAAHYGDAKMARELIRYGADVNGASRLGLTGLHVASDRGDAKIVDMLLDEGAKTETRESHGLTPLMMAARNGNAATVDSLLDAGAEVDAVDPDHHVTALMLAGWYAHPEATKRLLRGGASVSKATKVGPKPRVFLPGFGGGSHGDGIVRGGLPPEGRRAPWPGGFTPLHYAIRAGDLESVRMLVDAGADIEKGEANDIKALLMAILNGRIDIAQYLIDQGAKVNAQDWYGRAPLFAAVELRNLEMPANSTDNGVDRPAAFALIKRLVEKGANVNKRVEKYFPVRDYLMEGGSIQWVDFTGQTPFLRAALSGDVDTMRLLLSKGADPNINTYRGTTPLLAAAGVNWVYFQTYDEGEDKLIEAIRICMEHGQDVNHANSMGITPLMGAANRGANKILKFLVDKGAKLDARDNVGRSPLTWAKGVFLATIPALEKPSTMALINQLCEARGLQCEGNSRPAPDRRTN